jgi:integrase
MLSVYTRHYPPCTHTDINHRRCHCPKWIQGTLPDGRSIRTSAQTRSWEKAEVKMRAIEDAADPHKPAIKSRVTIDDAIQSFRDDERSRHLSKDSQKKSEFFFGKQLKSWTKDQGFVFLDQLTPPALTQFRAGWGNASTTTRRKHERLAAFFWFCVRMDWIDRNPALLMKRVKVQSKPTDYFTQEEFNALVDATYAYGKTTALSAMRLDKIGSDQIEALRFPGSPSNANCALRTLRRMLHKAEEYKLLQKVPRFKLMKEYGRSLRLDDESERKLIAAASSSGWPEASFELFRDIVVAVRETGMRNQRELYRMRVENIDWANKVIFVPDSKTFDGRRLVPMSDRVERILRRRCGDKREGWVFGSNRSRSGHINTIGKRFREARCKAGLPESLVLYCGRHDYGTRVLKTTGNLAAVMKTMGHKDVKIAMQYQHTELDIVRNALNQSGDQQIFPQTVQPVQAGHGKSDDYGGKSHSD